ncbi:5'-nucleotidase C-terminal domain-containing protein [Macrococcoides canis]|uniref:5'-nucleotidase C-terminal domain-containing protein n=1 Tax=Macrococcoides canis TaxID=1855823 RepID=UPI00165D4E3D|nr:5'-nucleotidase C-terminal domain-containing protein [Macrococcus canis]QNR08565.1 hypothetical protein GL258_10070 [Macrococcus canis]
MYKLSILATTDTHSHVSLYDYFMETYSEDNGLILAGSKIDEIRHNNDAEGAVTVVVDNGDILQGNILADYAAEIRPQVHPAVRMMNEIKYDVATFGNHEFNYGLDYLKEAITKAEFPFVNCNVKYINGDYVGTPFVMFEKAFSDGEKVKIGVTGVVPEQILKWDEGHLRDKVIVEDMYQSLYQYAHQMKSQGADVVIALMHTGLDKEQLDHIEGAENMVYHLAQIDAVDAFVFGHTHQAFPGPDYIDVPHIDVNQGKIFNAYGVQPMCFGSHLGEIILHLEKTATGFDIVDGKSTVHALKQSPIHINETYVAANKATHEAILNYINQPIGYSEQHIESYFAQIGVSRAAQIVAQAGRESFMQLAKRDGLNVKNIIATSAPIKAGRDGVNDYIDIKQGPLTLKDAINIYRFPNIMSVVQVSGKVLKEWVEWSVSCFNKIDKPFILKDNKSTAPGFPSYNMDLFYELTYSIDLTQEARYGTTGEAINNSQRVVDLQYEGSPVIDDDIYTVITNDYRTNFCPILKDESVVKLQIEPLEVRQCIIDYIKHSDLNFELKRPFSFVQEGVFRFKSSPEGIRHIQEGMTATQAYDGDYLIYEISTNKQ